MKKLLALLLLSPLASADIKDEINGKILINSSGIDTVTNDSYIMLKKDNGLIAQIQGYGADGVKTYWVGAYEWSNEGKYISFFSDDFQCTYYVKKVGKFYSFEISVFPTKRSYSNICPNLLMKISAEAL